MTKARTLADNYAADINQVTADAPLTGGGTSGTVTVGIQAGTTAQSGAVQLTDSTASTSVTTAATPNSVKSAYDLANGAIAKSTVDAKGDLLVGTANDTVSRLAVASTAGYLLSVDSAEATGLKWTPAPSSGGMTLLSTTNLSGSTQVTVSNISQDYTDLRILINNAVKPNGTGDQQYNLNPNGASNASGTIREANTGDSYTGSSIQFAISSPQTDQPRSYFVTIHNYASTTAYKTFVGGGIQRRADNAAWEGTATTGGLQSNNAITSVVLESGITNWSGGQLLIYGVK
jgi:hypothetical protein